MMEFIKKMLKDTKFIVKLVVLLSLNLLALYILNFVSFQKIENDKSREFLIKLSNIDNLDFKYPSFSKKICSTKIAVRKEVNAPIIPKKRITKKNCLKKDKYFRLKDRFRKTNDYGIALKLSRLYYIKGDYKKSLKWAEIANELNKKDDGSWILFAKSKIKLGDNKSAKKALLTYNYVYKSKRVEKLLERINI